MTWLAGQQKDNNIVKTTQVFKNLVERAGKIQQHGYGYAKSFIPDRFLSFLPDAQV